MSERDYAFEALAEVTSTDWNEGRGELNAALKSIREQSEIEDGYLLAAEIHDRAKMYRQVFADAVLTPTALSKHWKRVLEESDRPKGSNLHADLGCQTCGGDKFVLVNLRAVGDKDVTAVNFEEWAPCPDCNHSDVSFWRPDGTKFRAPDPGRVREMMRG
jgi:hypothetical protein